jgi:hypothetical protein
MAGTWRLALAEIQTVADDRAMTVKDHEKRKAYQRAWAAAKRAKNPEPYLAGRAWARSPQPSRPARDGTPAAGRCGHAGGLTQEVEHGAQLLAARQRAPLMPASENLRNPASPRLAPRLSFRGRTHPRFRHRQSLATVRAGPTGADRLWPLTTAS